MRRTLTSVRQPLIPKHREVRPGLDDGGGGEIPGVKGEVGRVLSPEVASSKMMRQRSIPML